MDLTARPLHRLRYEGLMYASLNPEEKRVLVEGARRCAVCEASPGDSRLIIDHDHETGVVRGVLCGSCNVKIGHLENINGDWLVEAVKYLDTGEAYELHAALAELVKRVYEQRHAERLEEIRKLEEQHSALEAERRKIERRLSLITRRFNAYRFIRD